MTEMLSDEFDLVEIHEAIGKWAEENFGAEQPPEFPLVGAGEELGELTTSILKRAQGIDDNPKYADRVGDDAERDAIADVAIYLCDFMYRADVDVDGVNELLHDGVEGSDVDELDRIADELGIPTTIGTIISLYGQYGEIIEQAMADGRYLERELATFLGMLVALCGVRGFDFEDALAEAMAEVLDREWDAEIVGVE